jgi:hypothetical protein
MFYLCYLCQHFVQFQYEAGRMQLEGAMCEEYFKIRELLYNQYAII